MNVHLHLRRTILLGLVVCLLEGPALATAGPLTDVLKARQARLDALLARIQGEPSQSEREQLGRILTETIDFAEMGKECVGTEWAPRSEAERAEYVAVFETFLRASLLRKPDVYRYVRLEYGPEAIEGGSGKVTSTVRTKDATTEVAYTFRQVGGRWRMVDYALDGVSTVRNYRSQFTRIREKSGWSGLLDRLRKRTAELNAVR